MGARLAEVVAVLSLAAEAGTTAAVVEIGPRTSIVAAGLARALDYDDAIASDAFYLAPLKYIGCVGDSDIAADLLGDEVAIGGLLAGMDFGDPAALLPALLRLRYRGLGSETGIVAVIKTLMTLPRAAAVPHTHCELAQMLARELSVSAGVVRGVAQMFERWNDEPGRSSAAVSRAAGRGLISRHGRLSGSSCAR